MIVDGKDYDEGRVRALMDLTAEWSVTEIMIALHMRVAEEKMGMEEAVSFEYACKLEQAAYQRAHARIKN